MRPTSSSRSGRGRTSARTPGFRVGDKDVDVPIEITEQRQVFRWKLDAEPSQMIFDPGRVVLAQRKIEKAEPVWIAELHGATLALDREAAAAVLGKRGGVAAEAALMTALEKDKFWAVRGSAAQALAQVVDKGDSSYFVEAEACLALGKTRTGKSSELLRKAATRESFTDVIRQHAYRGLAEARDDGAVALLVDGMRYGRPTQGRRAAAGALAHLMRGRRDREARDARERIELLLGDRDFRVQAAAIEALNVLGDPAAIPALRRTIERELDGRLKRRGREVIRDLGEGAPLSDDVRRLRDEVGELRAVVVALRERLDQSDAVKKPAAKRKKR